MKNEKAKLLLVDDEPNLTSALVRSLDRSQFEIFTADSAQQGLLILAGHDIDVVVSDERMPGMTGSQFLSEVRKRWPNTIRMILSGQADLEAAVRAINEGEVYRFLLKPCHPKELQLTIQQGLQHKKLVAQSRRLLQEHQKTQNLLDELEKANPGITKIDVDEDGAIDMEGYGEAEPGNAEDVQSLLDDLEKEMAKIGSR
jgi:two-component system probable response regulator PhcQ